MRQSILRFDSKPSIVAGSSVCGALEHLGPLSQHFDEYNENSKFSCETWEKAESEMIRRCISQLLQKAALDEEDIDSLFSGDLTNQCTATSLAIRGRRIPTLGLYGACSTFAMAIGLASSFVHAGYSTHAVALASSHFCTSERQFRYPLEYGCQRTPTAQTTVTACGTLLIGKHDPALPCVTEFLPGIICDRDIHDTSHMGAAMAPACADTLIRYFRETGIDPANFDMILTGDLGFYGIELLRELCRQEGIILTDNLSDCGLMIYDRERQNVGAGGSGCGCSAGVFSGYIMDRFMNNEIKDILFIGTGALLSSSSVLQKESIPGIAHLVRIQKE